MDRFFDLHINTVSLTGRWRQVQYAKEAVGRSSPCLAIKCVDGILMAAAKRNPSELMDFSITPWKKIFKISNDVICGVSGLMGDAKQLVQDMRDTAAKYEHQHGMPIEVAKLADAAAIKYVSTMDDPLRPFGVSFVCAGWHSCEGYQVYQTDPSGNCSRSQGAVIGKGCGRGMNVLETAIEDKSLPTLEEAKGTAIKAMGAMLVDEYFDAKNIEMATLGHFEQTTGIETVPLTVLAALIDKYNAAELEVEAA